ncbi:MAG TPA: hypothetical protein RMH85_18975 [Polyangiaceae bacterium LLY-WYZ-15_(1-7)]|nr:hypothetical protein [Myxococcales bacterium]MAT29481.1 hypothetical protein [Sandaracinus sp.]HJK89874.1 hypothetical protein [Polyangiaceae bacterium LLY-WYZ-15_(1-7)]MBJ70641.1 hypothetical protein [Sandaracinus sp.]HJL05093.1 hypothetical protein [Polyangiaceae bacterium LLY-WYZ-15_(1-7)]
MSRHAPLALAPLLLLGCFRSSGAEPDDTCDCCGVEVRLLEGQRCNESLCAPICRSVRDGGAGSTCDCCGTTIAVRPGESCGGGVCDPYCAAPDDAGVDSGPDAGRDCSPRAATLACYSYVPEGSANRIDVRIGGEGECYCGESVGCVATLSGERQLSLETSLCTDGFLCDACFPFVTGTCELPPVEEGVYDVLVNGDPGFRLAVGPDDVFPEWGLTCHRMAERTECGVTWPPRDYAISEACHPDVAPPERPVAIRLTDECGGCGSLSGPCRVDVFDDLVRVFPSRVEDPCAGDCPPVCMPREEVCYTPPLPAGTWRVQVDGLEAPETTIVVGSVAAPETVCTPEP